MTSITIRVARRVGGALFMSMLLGAAVQAGHYTVRSGDTLYGIARTYHVDSAALLRLNGLSSSTLNVGQVLQVPELQAAAPAQSGSSPAARAAAAVANTVQTLPPGLPKLGAGPVRGPVAWNVTPAPTVASFVGWLPTIATTAFGNALPIRTYLEGLAFERQTFNNCGPSALSAVLGFYKAHVSQEAIRRTTRPGNGYMQVSAIAPELSKFGLNTTTIRGGQLGQVKRLLALGIPVIVLQWYDRPGHIDHFRVVRGYDDQAGLVWVSDSMVGPVSYLSYASFDALWNTQGRQMFPVYPKGFEAQVRALI